MSPTFDFEIKLAGREWARQFYTGVVRSLAKTVTEPITNSDTSYKRKNSLPDASGLVARALAFKKGTVFDLAPSKADMSSLAQRRLIEVHLYTAQGHGRKQRTCEVVDFAEGLTLDELRGAFEMFAADKTAVSKGKPGRSLFGRGVSDVLLGHKDGTFYSYRGGDLTKVEFSFDPAKNSAPKVKGVELRKPTLADLRDLHLQPNENGSCVRVTLHDDCRIPDEGTIVPYLAQFYMLRLINADPNVAVRLVRHRSGGKIFKDELDYDFPIGDVIETFSFEISDPVPGAAVSPLLIHGIVCRATLEGGLPSKQTQDQRANGLLIVDDNDAVLDLTLLPDFNNAPYLANIFGIVRVSHIREVLNWFLNNGKDSPLTTTRDGFDQKHEFTKLLFGELAKHLIPVYKREEQRFEKADADSLSTEAKKRINDAIKELNRLLKKISGEGEGEEPEPTKIDPSMPLQFIPASTRLTVSVPRAARLYLQSNKANSKGAIIYDTSNPLVSLAPPSIAIREGKKSNGHLVFVASLRCDKMHEHAKITALADGPSETYEANLDVVDVIAAAVVMAPAEMEFRPRETRGQPNRNNSVTLYVNTLAVPLGRKIRFQVEISHGAITLNENGNKVEELSVVFDRSQIIPSTNVGRISISWRGSGWGQSARLVAETKKPDGTRAQAVAILVLEQPEETGGMIREVRYRDLQNEKCSDLVDGVIYINSAHCLNRSVFGATQEEYNRLIEKDRTAQYRFSALVVEQAVFALAESEVTKNKLQINPAAPVTSIREFVDQHTNDLAPKVLKAVMTGTLIQSG